MAPETLAAPRATALAEAFARLETLRGFAGAPAEFWPQLLQVALPLTGGTDAALLTRARSGEEAGIWKPQAAWPTTTQLPMLLRLEKGPSERLGALAEGDGVAVLPEKGWIAARLETGETQRSAIVVVRVGPEADAEESATRLRLLAAAPLTYQLARSLEQAKVDMARFAVVLDLSVLLHAQEKFLGAALTLCNELAARYRCERVSLGWLQRGHVRLQAMSHTEKFERRMALAAALEATMDEALDQDEEILWPPLAESTAVTRDHEAFARTHAVSQILSLPLRLNGEPQAVLTLERAQTPAWTTTELQTLRLLCDHTARRLQELRQRDRWFGARWATALRGQGAKLLGPEHTAAKLWALAGSVALGILLFGTAEYRVEAPFILKTDELAQVPAPFDGFLEEVHFRVGDAVSSGQALLALDTRELLLEESAALAARQKFLAEAQQAEGTGDAAAMRIAQAGADEAKARLDMAQYQLQQAQVAAPFTGYVVEGDLRERLSAPVKQGEVLVKVAKLGALYAELSMPERDIHEILAGQAGELAFASRPQWQYPLRVERVEPVAQVKEKGNVFILRAEFAQTPEEWWRPGMSGVAKVHAGRRNLLWIITHRTVDFLRLYLWW